MSNDALPPEIVDAISRIDAEVTGWPDGLLADWRRVRGYCRARHRESQRVLPAISIVAQEISRTQTHAAAAMKAMEGLFGRRAFDSDSEDEVVTATHRVLDETKER